jgi:hypothetical protein
LQQAIDLACQVMLVAPTDVPRVDDRYIAASEVLSSLQN